MTLDAGLAALDDIYDATDPIRVSRFWIRDYHPERRPLSVTEIFLHSSNIGSAKMAMQVGARGQREFLSRLGMFERLPIELPGAMVPPVPQPWGDAKTMTVAYGHGIAVSPLHLATGVASLVNGGRRVYPTILQRLADDDGLGERVISEATSLNLRRLLRLAVTSKDGTGSRADVPGYSVGGKTGTANKAAGGRYAKNAKLSSFVGIFPAEAPRYLVFVVLDEPQGRPETYNYATGGWTAAPAVGAVISRIAPILGVRPRFDDDPLQLAAMRGVD
jgi:cell division protein FtsI (penicillin-binding protein 3)